MPEEEKPDGLTAAGFCEQNPTAVEIAIGATNMIEALARIDALGASGYYQAAEIVARVAAVPEIEAGVRNRLRGLADLLDLFGESLSEEAKKKFVQLEGIQPKPTERT